MGNGLKKRPVSKYFVEIRRNKKRLFLKVIALKTKSKYLKIFLMAVRF